MTRVLNGRSGGKDFRNGVNASPCERSSRDAFFDVSPRDLVYSRFVYRESQPSRRFQSFLESIHEYLFIFPRRVADESSSRI